MDSADWTLSVLRPWPVDGLVHLNHWQLWQDVQIQELTHLQLGFLRGSSPNCWWENTSWRTCWKKYLTKIMMRKYSWKNKVLSNYKSVHASFHPNVNTFLIFFNFFLTFWFPDQFSVRAGGCAAFNWPWPCLLVCCWEFQTPHNRNFKQQCHQLSSSTAPSQNSTG